MDDDMIFTGYYSVEPQRGTVPFPTVKVKLSWNFTFVEMVPILVQKQGCRSLESTDQHPKCNSIDASLSHIQCCTLG